MGGDQSFYVPAMDSGQVRLKELGYKQELKRDLSVFSNFAISFSIISVLTGITTTYNTGLRFGGTVTLVYGWFLAGSFTMCVGLSMAEICSSYPTSGGLYYWSAMLAGPRWAPLASWMTGWFNIVGQWAVTASVDFSLAQLIQVIVLLSTGGRNGGGYKGSDFVVIGIHGGILFIHALLNSLPISVLSFIGQLAALWNLLGVLVLMILIPLVSTERATTKFVFTNFNTDNGLGITSYAYIFVLGLLMSQYTITGYDASAHMTEETVDADKNGPRGIISAIGISILFGWGYILGISYAVTDIPSLLSETNNSGWIQEIDLGVHTIKTHGGRVASKHKHDWIILVILIAIEIGLNLISPFYRYVGKDMMTDLKYPFKDNTVPIWSVPVYAVLLPFVLFVCFYLKRRCVYDLHHSILGLLFAVLITGVITDSIKVATGRPRPNFYWRCFPDGKELYDALGGVICHGKAAEVKEGHKSFPSGHASWSFAGLTFLSLYLSGKIKAFNGEGHVAKLCLVIFPLLAACLVGISRVDDYWHHWQDVFAGALIGILVAAFCYRQFYPNPYHEEGWGPYAYFTAAQERGVPVTSSQNGDALRAMSLQMDSTSLENMESGTSTAPR